MSKPYDGKYNNYVDQIFSSTEPIFLEIRQAFASF